MNIIKNRRFGLIFGISFLILLSSFVWVFLGIEKTEMPLVIHFDVFKGIDYWGNQSDIFWILTLGLIMLAINLFLAEYIFDRQRFFSFVFAFVSLGLSALTLIAALVMISVN